MNISAIQSPSSPQVTWSTTNAQEKDADFLKLRLLNKRTRARISSQPLDLSVNDGRGTYLAVSNLRGWFAAIVRNDQGQFQIVLSSLRDLREFILSSKVEGEDNFVPKRVVQVVTPPIHLAFACHDECLVVGFVDGSISVYSTSAVFTPGERIVEPIRTFPPGPPGPLRQVLANPGDLPELVAIRRDAESGVDGICVEILNVKELRSLGGWRTGDNQGAVPASIAWSAKGKQLAIGLKTGDIVTYSPTDTNSVKLHVPKPPSLGDFSVISLLWLSNQAFYGIYSPASDRSPEAPQKHVLTLYDPKTNSANQTLLETPYYASPALRPPGAFTVVMRNWNPAKVLIFVGDSTSSDIGLVGSVAENDIGEAWCNLTLEETSTPSVPLDKDAEDTIPLALDMDLTTGEGEQVASTSPILYLYASDGALQAWFVSNDIGGRYSGMVTPTLVNAMSGDQISQSDSKPSPVAPFSQPSTASVSVTSNAFSSATPAFGQTSGGDSADFSQQPAPAFSQPSFGQKTSAPAFGGGATGQGLASGFGAFGSAGPSQFGTPGFGFGGTNPSIPGASTTPKETPAADAASPEAEMSDADAGDADKLGGLSLGGTAGTDRSEDKAANSMFGAFSKPTTTQQSASSTFGGTGSTTSFGAFGNVQGSGFLKPASGFGAFLKQAEPQSTSKDTGPDQETKSSPAFGTSGFGTPGFGTTKPQSGFGQPAFGQSSFGSPSTFVKASPFSSPSPSSAGGSTTSGFSAFAGASKGFASFAQGGSPALGQQAQPAPSKLSEAPSITMASSTEDMGKGSAPPSATESKSPSPFSAATSSDETKPSTSPFVTGVQNAPAAQTGGSSSPDSAQGTTTPKSRPPTSQDRKQSSVFSTPIARTQSPISSPEGTPTPDRTPKIASLRDDSYADAGDESISSPTSEPSTTPFGTPAPSIFKTSGTVPAGGAFGNLTTTQSAFKPAEGFGAFGSSLKSSTSSPFANPKPAPNNAFSTPVKPMSAFGVGGSGPSGAFGSSPDSTTPKFGTPSTPTASSVFGKLSFGTPATPSPASTTPLTTPVPNAFTAYSGSGGFSAFAKAGKPSSFSDLLKSSKDEEAKAPNKDNNDMDGSFVTVSKPEEVDQDNLPPTPSTHGTFDEEEQNLDDGGEEERDDVSSFLSESFSEEAGEEEAEENEEGEEEEDEDEDEEEGEEEDEEEESESESTGEEEVNETPSRRKEQSPTTIPLPESRGSTPKYGDADEKKEREIQASSPATAERSAPGSTAQDAVSSKPFSTCDTGPSTSGPTVMQQSADGSGEKKPAPSKSPSPAFGKPGASAIPTLFGKQAPSTGRPVVGSTEATSPSPPLFGKSPDSAGTAATKFPAQRIQAESTTPPGSPGQQDEQSPLPAPKPVGGATSSGFGGFGILGSRPARSSPLATTSLSGEESKAPPGNQTPQFTSALPKPRPASPRTPFGQVPAATGQPKPPVPLSSKPEEANRQSPTPFSAPVSTLLPGPAQFAAPAQATSALASTLKAPLPSGQIPGISSPNAPFIMPQSAPTGPGGTPVSVFGAAAQQTGAGPAQQVSQPSAQPPTTQTTFESGMQRECQNLCLAMAGELEHFAKLAKGALGMKNMWGRPSGIAHSREILRDKTKWSFGDLETFSKLLKDIEKDVLNVYRIKDEFLSPVREAESNLLKAETRKEEIIRFSKAKDDPEFARILKARTLSPDASETQSQLRRQIRLINDRVEQLEAHLKSCKKKIEEHRKGRASIKAPSLDTVNRIYRNIDIAIEAQAEEIDKLVSRIAKLKVDDLDVALHGTPSPRRKRIGKENALLLHDDHDDDDGEFTSRPQVTPSVAASTAAALNAERSAMRLKNALLNARKTPLLNTQASQPDKHVLTLDEITRQNFPIGNAGSTGGGLPAPFDLSLSSLGTPAPEQDNGAENQQRRSVRQFSHARPVKLGKSQAPVPPSVASFDWGPLPKAQPVSALPFEIKPLFGAKNPPS